MRMLSLLFLLVPIVAHGAGSCPSGYIEIDRPDILIATDDVCPSGYISIGATTPCSSITTNNGTCTVFNICPDLPQNAYWTDATTCEYACNDGYGLTHENKCAQICTAGFTKLRTSTNISVPLYTARQTTPALNVNDGDKTCFGNLVEGTGTDTINVQFNGKTYHLTN